MTEFTSEFVIRHTQAAFDQQFPDTHADAVIEQRYKLADETLLELIASYADKQPDHRMMCQARER